VSYVKTTEPIKMQFGMVSRVGPRNFWGVWPIGKHGIRFWRVG